MNDIPVVPAGGQDQTYIWTAIGGTFALVIGSIVAGVKAILDVRHQHKKEDQSKAITEQKELIDKQRVDIDKLIVKFDTCDKELDRCKAKHVDCEIQYTAAIGRIEMLEATLEQAGMKVKPWTAKGSGIHIIPPELGDV
jgi:hypothetical protein